METVRALGYLRVSTDKQADEGVSLDAQRAKLAAYCDLYNLELVDIHVDAGASAKSMDRPELQRALGRLAAGEANALVVVKLDRLTRSVRDLSDLVELSGKQGWRLVSVSEQLDTQSAGGRLVLNVLMSVAQWEREAIGERTSAALQHKRARGEYTGGNVPFGYQRALDGALEPHEGERKAIRLARRLQKRGLSLRAIGAELVAKGHRPRGRSWNPKSVRDLLRAAA